MVEVSGLGTPVHLGTAPVYLGKYLSMFESDYQLGDGSVMTYTVASRHQDYHPSNVRGTDAVTLFVISKHGDKMCLLDYVVSVLCTHLLFYPLDLFCFERYFLKFSVISVLPSIFPCISCSFCYLKVIVVFFGS